MKIHTNNFKNNIKNLGREIDVKITFQENGQSVILGNEEINSANINYEGKILKSIMKQLTLDSNVFIEKGKEINFQFGIKVGNNFEYLNYGNFIVEKSEIKEDTKSWEIICYDKMLNFMVDYESLNITFPITVRNYINALVTSVGLTFANVSEQFANYDKIIDHELYLDSDGNSLGYTKRDVLDELAQATASIICIDETNGKVKIKYPTNTNETIDEEFLKNVNVNFGEKFGPINSIVLARAADSDKIYLQDEISIAQNGLCEIKISENQIMNFNNRDEFLPDILEVLDGFEYYINDFSSTGICYLEIGDKYNVMIDNEVYHCVIFNDEINISKGLEENIHTERLEESKTDYSKADKTDRKINQTYIMVDKQNGIIEELASKIVDVSNTISGTGSITLDNAYEGILHELSIKSQISLLFPTTETVYGYGLVPTEELTPSNNLVPSDPVPYGNETLYPSSTLFPKGNILLVDDVEYELDIDFLNYMNNTICDEFIYKDGQCKIIRRVGINNQGEKYALNKEVIEIRKNIDIQVKPTSVIRMKSFDNAILSCTYLTQNDYTDVFATQVEVKSELNIQAGKIEEKVSQVVDDEGNITGASIILAVNKDGGTAEINANKINLNGAVTANENFKILEDGSMETKNGTFKGTINGGAISVTGNYTEQNPYIEVTHPNSTSSQPIGSTMWSDGISCYNYGGGTPVIRTETADGYAELSGIVVNAYGFNNVSLKEEKKNFEFLKNALDIIKDTDIYKYNYKGEKDEDKKHIGLVIDKESKKNITPSEIIAENGKGIDLYSMISVSWKAIQELQEKIEKLENENNKK